MKNNDLKYKNLQRENAKLRKTLQDLENYNQELCIEKYQLQGKYHRLQSKYHKLLESNQDLERAYNYLSRTLDQEIEDTVAEEIGKCIEDLLEWANEYLTSREMDLRKFLLEKLNECLQR